MPTSPIFPGRRGRESVSYLIAAYAIVIGTLVSYGWWVRGQRRQLMRQAPPDARDEPDA
jgi:hypothetical protein